VLDSKWRAFFFTPLDQSSRDDVFFLASVFNLNLYHAGDIVCGARKITSVYELEGISGTTCTSVVSEAAKRIEL